MSRRALRSRYDRPEDSPGFLLWQVASLWQRRQRAALEPYALTHAQFVLLAAATWAELGHPDEPLTQTKLAHLAATDIMMTSDVIRTLERRRLVERWPHPTDARAKIVRPTKAGRALVGKALPQVEAVDAAFFAPLASEVHALPRTLQKLVNNQ